MVERGTHRRIAAELRRRISDGELSPGSMLPSEAALTSEFGVARGTVRSALGLLAGEGLVEVLAGQGRRVANPDGSSKPPSNTAYGRIAEDLRGRIAQGVYNRSDAMPSEADLMEEFGVSRTTVRRAYQLLADEHVVVIRHGAGAFPAPESDTATN